MAVVVGSEPYAAAEIAARLGCPVAGAVPLDRDGLALLGAPRLGRADRFAVRRSPLHRALPGLARALVAAVEADAQVEMPGAVHQAAAHGGRRSRA